MYMDIENMFLFVCLFVFINFEHKTNEHFIETIKMVLKFSKM